MRDKDIKLEKRHRRQKIIFSLLGLTLLFVLFILGIIIYFVFVRGIGVISWEFITAMPRNGMTEGGIFPSIVGTFYLVIGSILFATPLGVFAAIYMTEYANKGKIITTIRVGVNNLAGVASVVFGLFGLCIFV